MRNSNPTRFTSLILLGLLVPFVVNGCPRGLTSSGGNAPPASTDTNPLAAGNVGTAIVADHRAPSAFDNVPDDIITQIIASFRIFYGHTSHGSQLLTGANMLATEDARLADAAGATALDVRDNDGVDLGTNGELDWVDLTRDALDAPGADINVVMWSWCGGVSENSAGGITAYLNAMAGLEAAYPDVMFVYMTGHLDGTGPSGNLYQRNNQIRTYCRDNGKVLFDFADIESYDPDGGYYGAGSDACEWCATWCTSHQCATCDDCAHSACFNCYQKGRAMWWMLARMSGWTE